MLSLFQRLLESTDPEHGDYAHLQKAEVAVHELAMRINTMKESQRDECLQDTLKKLELLLLTDVKTPKNPVQNTKDTRFCLRY